MLPYAYDISFEQYDKDLIEQALNRLLAQHYDKCVLKQFVSVFIAELQEAYDAIIQAQKMRIVYNAKGENLDALGRIVGQERGVWEYDDSSWVFTDRNGQGVDSVNAWCINAELGTVLTTYDEQYRLNIISKAIKNHTLLSSVPELTNLIKLLLNIEVSFQKVGPNSVNIIVPSTITKTQAQLLTKSSTDTTVDNSYYIPYPATLDINNLMIYVPDDYFRTDDEVRTIDYARIAVGVPIQGE